MTDQLQPAPQLPGQMPWADVQSMAQALGGSLIPDYLKPKTGPINFPDQPGKMQDVEGMNPLPWMGIDAASMIPSGAAKGAGLAALHLMPWVGKPGFHHIVDDAGGKVGRLALDTSDPKNLYVKWVSSGAATDAPSPSMMGTPNSFGPKEIRSLLQALRGAYPEAKTVRGERISGARFGPASKIDTSENFVGPEASVQLR